METGMIQPPRAKPEAEPRIKVEEPEFKRFKKDEVLRAKTREDNIERDDKIARKKENLAREKMPARENLAREKMPARENLAREKMPARENKTTQNISTNATPVRAAASSKVLTSAYTLSARHDRSLGIITKNPTPY